MPDVGKFTRPEHGGWFVRLKLEGGEEFEYNSLRFGKASGGPTPNTKIHFTLPFGINPELHAANIRLLSANERAVQPFERGQELTLEAGWVPEQPNNTVSIKLIIADVQNYSVTRSQSQLEVRAIPNAKRLWTIPISESWEPGTKASQIWQDIASIAQLTIGKNDPEEEFVYRRGYVHWGTAWEAMMATALDTRSTTYTWNNRAFLMPRNEGIPTGFTLEPKTGLVRGQWIQKRDDWDALSLMPEEAERKNPQTEVPNVNFSALLDPNITPNAVIDVKNAEDLEQSDLRVRVLSGVFYNDGSKQRVNFNATKL